MPSNREYRPGDVMPGGGPNKPPRMRRKYKKVPPNQGRNWYTDPTGLFRELSRRGG